MNNKDKTGNTIENRERGFVTENWKQKSKKCKMGVNTRKCKKGASEINIIVRSKD
jgi:hypothetical protein